jgi:hypothetical protein
MEVNKSLYSSENRILHIQEDWRVGNKQFLYRLVTGPEGSRSLRLSDLKTFGT